MGLEGRSLRRDLACVDCDPAPLWLAIGNAGLVCTPYERPEGIRERNCGATYGWLPSLDYTGESAVMAFQLAHIFGRRIS